MRRFLMLAIFSILPTAAIADDNQVFMDAEFGNWQATSGTDDYGNYFCSALGSDQVRGLGFKASTSEGLQIRIVNKAWSLPPTASGSATLTVGKEKFSYDVIDSSSITLLAEVKPELLKPLLNAMDKGVSISIKIGKAPPFSIYLSGSTRVINSFRTCSSNHDFGDLGTVDIPGANPFTTSGQKE